MLPNGNKAAHYTPLESLLFFQALRAQDLAAIDFARISDDLVALPLVKDDAAFDADRLSPDALKNLYLGLVKEQARDDTREEPVNSDTIQNGTTSPSARKRKAESPPMPSVEAASKHAHLFPQLLFKLYARYRQSVNEAIKEEEKIVDAFDDETKQIESGQLDEQLRRESGLPAPTAPTSPALINGEYEESEADAALPIQPPGPAKPQEPASPPDAEPEAPRGNTDGAGTADSPALEAVVSDVSAPEPVTAPQRVEGDAQGLPAASAEHAPKVPLSPGPYAQSPPPALQHSPAIRQASPAASHFSPRTTAHSPPLQAGPFAPAVSSPHLGRPLQAAQAHASPVLTNGFQPPPHRGLVQMPPPSYGSPGPQQSPRARPAGPGFAAPQQQQYQHYQQYQPYPAPIYNQPRQQQQQQPYQIRPSQQGGVQLPPFQIFPQEPHKAPQHPPHAAQSTSQSQHSTPQTQPQVPKAANQSPYIPFPQYTPSTPQSPAKTPHDNQSLTNSVVASLRKRSSTSTWKPDAVEPLAILKSPPRPVPEHEPLSPTRAGTKLGQTGGQDKVVKVERQPQTKKASQAKSTGKTRGSSVASSTRASTTRGRTRSQSVFSHQDAAQADSAGTGNTIKPEPSTPAETVASAESPSARGSRRRRAAQQPPAPTLQRRSLRNTPQTEEVRNDTVMVTRNFSRLSSVILNEISAHRHAGPFQKPVSNRDVEGYDDIIRRPQDLKSIKAAVTAGSRAVTAALASKASEDEGDTTVGSINAGSTIFLAKTDDLMPPKGIVNSAQLEKEVMRMFANAVLFNPGDEGFVQDAREMAEDVAAKIQDWRGIERSGDRDDDEGGGGKRRKV